jgi:hypothetical protein
MKKYLDMISAELYLKNEAAAQEWCKKRTISCRNKPIIGRKCIYGGIGFNTKQSVYIIEKWDGRRERYPAYCSKKSSKKHYWMNPKDFLDDFIECSDLEELNYYNKDDLPVCLPFKVEDILNLYKCNVYTQLLQPEEVIKQISERFGVEERHIKTIIKDCHL